MRPVKVCRVPNIHLTLAYPYSTLFLPSSSRLPLEAEGPTSISPCSINGVLPCCHSIFVLTHSTIHSIMPKINIPRLKMIEKWESSEIESSPSSIGGRPMMIQPREKTENTAQTKVFPGFVWGQSFGYKAVCQNCQIEEPSYPASQNNKAGYNLG